MSLRAHDNVYYRVKGERVMEKFNADNGWYRRAFKIRNTASTHYGYINLKRQLVWVRGEYITPAQAYLKYLCSKA